jgi:hypothetical protein
VHASRGVVGALAWTYLLPGADIENGHDGIILRNAAVEMNAG